MVQGIVNDRYHGLRYCKWYISWFKVFSMIDFMVLSVVNDRYHGSRCCKWYISWFKVLLMIEL